MAFTRIAFALAEGRPWDLFGDGSQSRSFTYVGDVVDATILAMEDGSGTYNVGGGTELTVREAVESFERLAGRALDVREHPAVPGDQRRTKADTRRIREELGWQPATALEDGLRAQWEWAAARVAAR
jgi:UDP-glucuronate 4-epimerase